MNDLLTIAEVARLAGLRLETMRARVQRRSHEVPEPDLKLPGKTGAYLWRRETIAPWIRAQGRD